MAVLVTMTGLTGCAPFACPPRFSFKPHIKSKRSLGSLLVRVQGEYDAFLGVGNVGFTTEQPKR